MPNESVFSKLEKYQTDHLILLIGGNPLPNAVAALCLAKGDKDPITEKIPITGNITLIHSSQTKAISENLTNWLKQQQYRPIKETQIEQRSVGSLHNMSQIRAEINSCAKNSEDIGLHYTGGTKPMAVHAYRTIEQLKIKQQKSGTNIRAIFSYLNPDTLRMQFEGDGIPPSNTPSIYVAQVIPFTVEDIGDLHEHETEDHGLFSKKNPSLSHPILPKTCQAIATRFAVGDREGWNQLKGKFGHLKRPWSDRRQPDDTWRNWIEPEKIKKKSLDFSMVDQSIQLALQEELDLGSATTVKWGEIFKHLENDEFNDIELLLDFFQDSWLEHHVAHHLYDLEHQNSLLNFSDLKIGLSAKLEPLMEESESGDKKPLTDPLEFEVDVVGLRGYQIFLTSCTVSKDEELRQDKKVLKNKLFEVYRRAIDIGGSQSRIMLVCGANSKTKHTLAREIRTTLDSHIGVFGVKDWPRLSSEIAKWMKKEIGEP